MQISTCSSKKILFAMMLLFFFSITFSVRAQSVHPFLIVRKDQFKELQNRKEIYPWSEVVKKAKELFVSTPVIDTQKQEIKDACYTMRDLCDAASLLYITDPANKDLYRTKILEYLYKWKDILAYPNYTIAWEGTVAVGIGMFASVLAYDIIYDDLTDEQRNSIEPHFQRMADDFVSGIKNMGSHELNRWGASGIWYLFKNDPRKEKVIDEYRNYFKKLITEDGVYFDSPGYSLFRLSSGNIAKAHFMDVLEFTGADRSYYNNPFFQKLYKWMYSFAMMPNGYNAPFGDSKITSWDDRAPGIFRASKFGDDVAGIAAWRVKRQGYNFTGGLLNYVLMDKPLPEPKYPTSEVYKDGGAFFIQENADDNSFYGALWNTSGVTGHSHKDVNSICLYAYGECLIRNVGYVGWQKGYENFTWEDINQRAYTNNTVEVNNRDHENKTGAGIIDGITADKFDFACGDDGNAIGDTRHLRNFIMVHPQDNLNGYFITVDDLSTSVKNPKAQLFFHPNGNESIEVMPNFEYDWKIQPIRYTKKDVGISIFLATPPDEVQIKDGPLLSQRDNFIGKYIQSDYSLLQNGNGRIATIFYPYDETHEKAKVKRIKGNGFNGAVIKMSNNVSDFLIVNETDHKVEYEGVSFNGDYSSFRKAAGESSFCFIRNGKEFNSDSFSFSSKEKVTMFLKNYVGEIITYGTEVTFSFDGIKSVKVDGKETINNSKEENRISAYIPEGNHKISLMK